MKLSYQFVNNVLGTLLFGGNIEGSNVTQAVPAIGFSARWAIQVDLGHLALGFVFSQTSSIEIPSKMKKEAEAGSP
jgi:hypothetical protein